MKKYFLILGITCLGLNLSQAQPISGSTYATMIKVAKEKLAEKDYYNALEWYEKAYDENNDPDLVQTIAQLHYQIRDYTRAERSYVRLFRRDKNNKYAAERFNYGKILKMTGKYPEAITELQTFINETDNDSLKTLAQVEIAGAEMANELSGSTEGVTVENLGRAVNSSFSEYSPTLDRNKSNLYFIGFDANEVIILDEGNTDYHAKVFTAAKEGDKGWAKPKALDEKINRPGVHTSDVVISEDGRTMYLTRSVLQGNVQKHGRIYYSVGGEEGWGAVNEVDGINGEFITKNPAPGELFGKEVLFFVSDMEGGFGGFDIYYATRKGDGVYADPVNLGPKINTLGDEITPFYRDGRLFFSSNGHPSFGGYDIFSSEWNGQIWSEPLNMGRGYNTNVDDLSFYIDKEGYNGLFTSNREGGRSTHGRTCCDDVYGFEIARLFANLVVGVFDDQKQVLKGATVQLLQIENNSSKETSTLTKPDGNRFDFGLELEKAFMVIGSKEGYFPDTISLNTVELKDSKTFQERFYLKAKPVPPPEPEYDTITIEQAFVLENILYGFDSDRIEKEAESDLQVVFELMNEYPEMRIELGSHTDLRGEVAYNENLSQRRAESARRWLVRKGIPRARIEAKGYGENEPQTISEKHAAKFDFFKVGDVLTEAYINGLANEEQKEAAHDLNRRTGFKIVEGPTSITIKRTRLKKNE